MCSLINMDFKNFTMKTSRVPDNIMNMLISMFILSTPERNDTNKICVSIERAHWYYSDVLMPRYKLREITFYNFVILMLGKLPFIKGDPSKIFYSFKEHRKTVPIYGAIMIDKTMTKVLLCKSNNGEFWSFPRGKHEDDETPERCAIREVMEETGYDITNKLDSRVFFEDVEGLRKVKYFVIRDVPDVRFAPILQGEISRIEWFHIADFPDHEAFRTVRVFAQRIREFVAASKPKYVIPMRRLSARFTRF